MTPSLGGSKSVLGVGSKMDFDPPTFSEGEVGSNSIPPRFRLGGGCGRGGSRKYKFDTHPLRFDLGVEFREFLGFWRQKIKIFSRSRLRHARGFVYFKLGVRLECCVLCE